MTSIKDDYIKGWRDAVCFRGQDMTNRKKSYIQGFNDGCIAWHNRKMIPPGSIPRNIPAILWKK